MKAVVIGSINIDHVINVEHIANPGETIKGEAYVQVPGGKGLNQAIALSRLCPNTMLIGSINENDSFSMSFLEKSNLDISLINKTPEPTGTAFIQVDQQGENSIVIVSGANGKTDITKVLDFLSRLDKGDMVVLQNEINDIDLIVDYAYDNHLSVVLNPSPITNVITMDLIKKVKYLILNEVEMHALAKTTNIDKALNKLLENNPTLIIVLTLGEQGAIYKSSTEELKVKAYKVDVVDTTCAGDTFLGFFIGSIIKGMTLETSLYNATKAASICITRKGASPTIPMYPFK